ncbi:hypothetical protein Hanom_Chr16g01516381 [Helianthus anomalus]
MSSTIFSSLTTFFGGNGHHSPSHPTISPKPTIPHTESIHHAVNFLTRASITRYKLKVGVGVFFLSLVDDPYHSLYFLHPASPNQ